MTVKIKICECRDGDIIADDVMNINGVKLVSKGTTLNEYIIRKLQHFDINNVSVIYPPEYTKSTEYKLNKIGQDYNTDIRLVKNIIGDLTAGKSLDTDKVMAATEIIYNNLILDDIKVIIKFLDKIKNSDEYTYQHSINVAFYSMLLAKWIGLTESEIKKSVQGGLLHDIGKSKIPIEILNKTSKLTKNEFEVIKKHPVYGYYILDESNFTDLNVKRAVLLHHERINRTGYPFNISAEKIGILTRIVSVADVYDAMTSNRVYKKKATPFAAFEMFMTEGYTNFDTYITNKFISNMSTYLIGSEVLLSNGERGKIVYVPPESMLKPIIYSNGRYFSEDDDGINIEAMI